MWLIAFIICGVALAALFVTDMARKRRSSYQPHYFSAGPWVGMCDSTDVVDAKSHKAKLIKNMMPLATESGLAWVTRPGYVEGATGMGNKGQGLFEFRLAS